MTPGFDFFLFSFVVVRRIYNLFSTGILFLSAETKRYLGTSVHNI